MLENMQGLLYHSFAAVMTLTILTFPTPSDLRDAVVGAPNGPAKAIEIGQLPTVVAFEPPVNRVLMTEDLFPVVASCFDASTGLPLRDHPECRSSLDKLAEVTGISRSVERISYDQQALNLAGTYLCRAQWAEMAQRGEPFDASACVTVQRSVENVPD